MLLTDPLAPDAVAVLRILHRGYRTPSGSYGERWPIWQWVRWQAAREGLDADAVLHGLPTWQQAYRPICDGLGDTPALTLELTVHGLAAVGDDELLPVFLAALAIGAEFQQASEPDPYAPTKLVIGGDMLTAEVERRSGYGPLQATVVRALLEREPPTVLAHNYEPRWEWDLTRAPLRRFLGVTTVEDYLQRLDEMVGVRPPAVTAMPVPPLALVDALDHLNAEWTVTTGQRLLRVQQLSRPAQLAQPVNSGTEFETACSALDDLLKKMEPHPAQAKTGTLNQLDQRLSELLPADAAARAKAAVRVLRQVNALRVGQQHAGTGPYRKQQQARCDLGLAEQPGDWTRDWQRLQRAVIDALRALRGELASAPTRTP